MLKSTAQLKSLEENVLPVSTNSQKFTVVFIPSVMFLLLLPSDFLVIWCYYIKGRIVSTKIVKIQKLPRKVYKKDLSFPSAPKTPKFLYSPSIYASLPEKKPVGTFTSCIILVAPECLLGVQGKGRRAIKANAGFPPHPLAPIHEFDRPSREKIVYFPLSLLCTVQSVSLWLHLY